MNRVDTMFTGNWSTASWNLKCWLAAFVYYDNFQQPYQTLDNRTLVEEVQNHWLDST